MKLNLKGKALQKWGGILWDEAIKQEIAEKGEDNAEQGWSVAENRGFIRNFTDFAGLLLEAEDERILEYLFDWLNYVGIDEDGYGGEISMRDLLLFVASCGYLTAAEKARLEAFGLLSGERK